MPTTPLPDDLRELLAKPNPAVIATLRSDGQPVSVATWYLLEGDRFLVNMDEGRKRLSHLRRDPRVSLTVLDRDDWLTHVSVQGRVGELVDDVGLVDIDRLSRDSWAGTTPAGTVSGSAPGSRSIAGTAGEPPVAPADVPVSPPTGSPCRSRHACGALNAEIDDLGLAGRR